MQSAESTERSFWAAVSHAIGNLSRSDQDVIVQRYQREGNGRQLCCCSLCFPHSRMEERWIVHHIKHGKLLTLRTLRRGRHSAFMHGVQVIHPRAILGLILQARSASLEGNPFQTTSPASTGDHPSHADVSLEEDPRPQDPRLTDEDASFLDMLHLRTSGMDGGELCGPQRNFTPSESEDIDTRTNISLEIYAIKTKWALPEGAVNDILHLLRHYCTADMDIPESEADISRDIQTKISPETYKYDVCPNANCRALFRCEAINRQICERCGTERSHGYKFYYSPVASVLSRLFAAPSLAEMMTYSAQRKSNDLISDVVDQDKWRELKNFYPLSNDDRSVIISFQQDGMQPFKSNRSLSLEPFSISILNLPPSLRGTPGIGIFLIGLPEYPRMEKTGVLYPLWSPFIDEIRYLFYKGIEIYDSFKKEIFRLHVGVLNGKMDSRGWSKNNGFNGPGAIFPCFATEEMGFHSSILRKVIYPRFHAHLGRSSGDLQLRRRCSELNQPTVETCERLDFAGHGVDFSSDAQPPKLRQADETRELCQAQEEKKKRKAYKGNVDAVKGVTGYSELWDLPGPFSLLHMVYDPMHSVANCLDDIIQVLNGDLFEDRDRARRIMEYEHNINSRFLNWTNCNQPPNEVSLSKDAYILALARLERIVEVAPVEWRGMTWQFVMHKKSARVFKAKSHDKFFFLGCIGAFALDGLLPGEYGETIMQLIKAFSSMKTKIVAKDEEQRLSAEKKNIYSLNQHDIKQNIISSICRFFSLFPGWVANFTWHQVIQILDHLPLTPLSMWAVERLNRFLAHLIKNKSAVFGSLTNHYSYFVGSLLHQMGHPEQYSITPKWMHFKEQWDEIIFPRSERYSFCGDVFVELKGEKKELTLDPEEGWKTKSILISIHINLMKIHESEKSVQYKNLWDAFILGSDLNLTDLSSWWNALQGWNTWAIEKNLSFEEKLLSVGPKLGVRTHTRAEIGGVQFNIRDQERGSTFFPIAGSDELAEIVWPGKFENFLRVCPPWELVESSSTSFLLFGVVQWYQTPNPSWTGSSHLPLVMKNKFIPFSEGYGFQDRVFDLNHVIPTSVVQVDLDKDVFLRPTTHRGRVVTWDKLQAVFPCDWWWLLGGGIRNVFA